MKRAGAACFLLVCAASVTGEEDWPQWLGPTRDGVAAGRPPARWPEQLTQRWTFASDPGASSPIVAGGLVFLQGRTAKEETVVAVDLETGAEAWRWRQPLTAEFHREGLEFAPASTPCFHKGRVYVHSVNSALVCVEAKTGRELWKRDFKAEPKRKGPLYGPAASPVVVNGAVVLPVGDGNGGWVTAFDVESGATAWEVAGTAPGYGSPVVAKLGDDDHLLVFGLGDLRGLVQKNGSYVKAWEYPFRAGEGNQSTPAVLGKDTFVITHERETRALRVARHEGEWKVDLAWESDFNGNMATPHVFDGRVYLHAQRKLLCLSGESGEVLSRLKLPGRYCSLARLDATLLCLSHEGKLTVVDAAKPEMRVLAEYSAMNGEVWSHLAVAGGNLLVRGRGQLRCYTWEPGNGR